ncbi:four-carbon acid sugar kinase family protein [Paenibacillus montanisoli]|uniref:Four-carbon acid sugar kinase N-terminal domain-containing protein n=1 Tax=Paenibacillus montanisoli TaxID=2081970 RepID=A0A328U459_9BACL|nr:four-carbon acid sugar kinase family protein [Paenibacillus montanisoli]RAP77627.1 hypothetical protein DL346_03905 [Paenibacillus montanisoli]
MSEIREEEKELAPVTIVLDDDPTGTQTVSGVTVLLKPDFEAIRAQLAGKPQGHALYVLTNSRSLPEAEAVRLIRRIKTDAERAAAEAHTAIRFLLRGDSTLRGHVFAEIEALGGGLGTALFVPAFPECGRVTRCGVHYLLTGETWTPVAETEFARDPVFGYKSATLQEWVQEASGGRRHLKAVTEREYAESGIAAAICRALREAEPGTIVIPDAESVEDRSKLRKGCEWRKKKAPGSSCAARQRSPRFAAA